MKSSNYNHVIPQKKINLNLIQLPHIEVSSLPLINSPQSSSQQSCPKTESTVKKNTFYFDSSETSTLSKLNESVQSSSEKIQFSTRRNFSANQNKNNSNNNNKILKINSAFPSDFFSPVKTIHLKLNSNSNNTNTNGVSSSISTKESMGSLVNSSQAKNSQENDNEKFDIEEIVNIDESIQTKNSELDVTATFGKFMFQDFSERAKTPAFNFEVSKLQQDQNQTQSNNQMHKQFQLRTNSSKKKVTYPQSAKHPQNQDEKLLQLQQKSNMEYLQMIKPQASKNIFSKNQQSQIQQQHQNLTVSGRTKLSKVLSYSKIDPVESSNLQYMSELNSTSQLSSFIQKKGIPTISTGQNNINLQSQNQINNNANQQQQQLKFKVKIPHLQSALKTLSSNDILNDYEYGFPKTATNKQIEKQNEIYKEDLEQLQQQQQQQQSEINQILQNNSNDSSSNNINNKTHFYMGTKKRKIISTSKNQQKSFCVVNNNNITSQKLQKQNNNINNFKEASGILNHNVTIYDLKSAEPIIKIETIQSQIKQSQLKSQKHNAIFTKKVSQQQQITTNTQLLKTNLNLNKLMLGKQQSHK